MTSADSSSPSARVRPIDLGVRWEPNAPSSVFFAGAFGKAELWLLPHFDDPDQSWVVLSWTHFGGARLMPHNDEARHLHPLYHCGLSEVLWAGEAFDTEWLDEVKAAIFLGNRPPLRHFIVLTKENTLEVVATGVEVERSPDPPAGGWIHRRVG